VEIVWSFQGARDLSPHFIAWLGVKSKTGQPVERQPGRLEKNPSRASQPGRVERFGRVIDPLLICISLRMAHKATTGEPSCGPT